MTAVQSPLSDVTDWLLDASSQITDGYFQLSTAGAMDKIYRERVYCYELYHQWRCVWNDGFRYSLGGETDKNGHRIIRTSKKPDFLVHRPGAMDNLLIMEVKPKNGSLSGIVKDLATLTFFRRSPANYSAAYFWMYGASEQEWPDIRARILDAVSGRHDIDLHCIVCFLHPRSGKRAIQVSW